MADKISVLKVEPGKAPEMIECGTGLHDLQEQVGGYIEVVYPFEDEVGIICNEEGKMNGMELNRALRDDGHVYDIIAGPFLIAGLTEDDFRSLTPVEFDEYEKMFHTPEMFVRIGEKITVIPVYNKEE